MFLRNRAVLWQVITAPLTAIESRPAMPPVLLPLPLAFVRLQPLPRRRLHPILASSSNKYGDTAKLRKLFPRARDMKIAIGRYKGRMLGTLPSSYLKWLVDQEGNREYDLYIWPGLAKVVLEDPYYQDRIEYEPVLRIFEGGAKGNFIFRENFDLIKAYREIGENYGWDWDDREGWSKVKRDYIGTSYSGRIPRKKDKRGDNLGVSENVEGEMSVKKNNTGNLAGQNVIRNGKTSGFSVGRKRGQRIERMRSRREEKMQMMKSDEVSEEVDLEGEEEEEEMKMPRSRSKKGTGRRVKEDLGRRQKNPGLKIDDEIFSFPKREENTENGEAFNPFPGRAALFQKLKREGKIK